MPPPPDRDEQLLNWPYPKFDLKVENIAHPGAVLFFQHINNPIATFRQAVAHSFKSLYAILDNAPTNVQRITLVLRPMDGVAYTHGSDTEKEIHLSLDHIHNCRTRAKQEIMGVLTHEVVHCYQYNAKGTCPGGLIEGIADFVRMHAKLSPPHWRQFGGDRWDAGYERTAYFLDWIEQQYNHGSKSKNNRSIVRTLNQRMKDAEYEESIFEELTGENVRVLWEVYCGHLNG